jgi:type II secretory pathway pseudopilin PulG
MPVDSKMSGLAITSLILGLFCFLLPAAILAIVLGHISRSQIRVSAGRLKGAGLALAGLVLGYIGTSMIPLLIVAAIAIPNLLRAKMAANEATAVGSLRTLNTAVMTYSSTYGQGFPAALENLSPPTAGQATKERAELIDSQLGSGQKTGYLFFYQTLPDRQGKSADTYSINADPLAAGTTGIRHFFTSQAGVIRVEADRPATENSSPLV